ncbi:MAG TPA: hypothetical protein VFZ53_13900 [Polyangiaceae bacterium]
MRTRSYTGEPSRSKRPCVALGVIASALLLACREKPETRARDAGSSGTMAAPARSAVVTAGSAANASSSVPLASSVPAASGSAEPAGDTALSARLSRVMKGELALGSLADGARGFVIRDGEGALRVCGAAVPLFLDAAARTLRFQDAGAPRCSPRVDLDVCLFDVRASNGGGQANFGLGFWRSPRGPVLAAALWVDGVGPKQVESAVLVEPTSCSDQDAGPVWKPSAPRPAPDAGKSSGADETLLRRLANGKAPFKRLVDPERGVNIVTCVAGDTVTKRGQHLCGKKAVAALENERARLRECIAMNEIFACRSEPRHAEQAAAATTCRAGIAGEYQTISEYRFRAGESGPVLDSVLHLSSAYAPLDEAPCVARLLAKQLGKACPPGSP